MIHRGKRYGGLSWWHPLGFGMTRGDAARLGGVGLQTVRDWALRFNERGPEGLIDPKGSGRPPRLNETQRQALVQVVESGRTARPNGG